MPLRGKTLKLLAYFFFKLHSQKWLVLLSPPTEDVDPINTVLVDEVEVPKAADVCTCTSNQYVQPFHQHIDLDKPVLNSGSRQPLVNPAVKENNRYYLLSLIDDIGARSSFALTDNAIVNILFAIN